MIPYKTVFTMMAGHKDAILTEGVRQGTVASGGAKPTVDMIKGAAFDYAKAIAKGWILPGVTELLELGVRQYVQARGARPTSDVNDPANVAWRDEFDNYLMQCLGEDTCRDIGQDFCGEYFTDNEFDTPDILTRAGQVAADRLVDSAIKGRSPAQVLAEIGIVAEDLAAHAAPQTAAQVQLSAATDVVIDETTARAHVERLVGGWAIKTGVGALDPGALGETLKLCFDDDFFLALGPIERLGGNTNDVPYFMAYHKASKTAVDDTVAAAFTAALSGQILDPVKPPPKPRGGKTKGAPAAVAPPPPLASRASADASVAGVDGAAIIRMLRETRLAKDEDLGKIVGVSRPQISAIVNKGKLITLTSEHRVTLAKAVEDRIVGLQTVLALLS